MSTHKHNEKKNGIIYLILLFALTLRMYGINFEVPHPDDYITVQGAAYFGLTHIEPTGYGLYGIYTWPAFTLIYIQIALFILYFFVGWLLGVFPDMESFRIFYITDPFSFYLIARIMCVLFGVGSVLALYYLARKLYSYKVGLLASLFLTVSFIHSFHSQLIRPDVPTTFFILLAIICCLLIIEKGALKYYIFAGIFTGLAIATKFTSGILIISVLIAHSLAEGEQLLNNKDKFIKKNFLSALAVIFGILILAGSIMVTLNVFNLNAINLSPDKKVNYEFISFLEFLLVDVVPILGIFIIVAGIFFKYCPSIRNIIVNLLSNKKLLSGTAAALVSFMVFDPLFFLDFKYQFRVFLTDPNFWGKNNIFVGVDSLGFWRTAWWYLKGALNWGAGFHIEIMAAIGLMFALYQKKRENLLILVFPLLYFLVIASGKFRWDRYVIPLMPFVALYAANFLYTFVDRMFLKHIHVKIRNFILLFAAIVIIMPPTYNILRYDYLLTQKDTRVIAKEWVEKNLPHGSKVGQDAYTGDISENIFKITKKFTLSDMSFNYYLENGFKYLLISDTQYNRYLAEPSKYSENIRFYKKLFLEGELIKEFIPRDDLWPKPNERFSKYHIHISPVIKVYRLNKPFKDNKGI